MNTTTTKIAGEAMTDEQLKPCPFCGCTTSPELKGNGIGDNWLECVDCGASTRLREDGAGSTKDWNRRALLASTAAVAGHFGSFEKWAENYGFHAELVDVHQYAKEASRDAWTSGYMAGYLEGGLDEADNTPTAPAQSCPDCHDGECYVDGSENCILKVAAQSCGDAEQADEAVMDDAQDAVRYRWLRDPKNDVAKVIDKVSGEMPYDEGTRTGGYLMYEYRSGEELDSAIDAARAKDSK